MTRCSVILAGLVTSISAWPTAWVVVLAVVWARDLPTFPYTTAEKCGGYPWLNNDVLGDHYRVSEDVGIYGQARLVSVFPLDIRPNPPTKWALLQPMRK